jgi:hypothetical protein
VATDLQRSSGFALLALAAVVLGGCGRGAPPISGAEPTIRLLSESQYRRTIADIFGEQITVGGTFDPLVRANGLLTVGAGSARITPAGLEQFDRMARSIASQVLSEGNREGFVPCGPASATAPDATRCARCARRRDADRAASTTAPDAPRWWRAAR